MNLTLVVREQYQIRIWNIWFAKLALSKLRRQTNDHWLTGNISFDETLLLFRDLRE
jgi:hypothetical protein